MSLPTYRSLLTTLHRYGVPFREIGSTCKVAVTQSAGRIIGASFAPDDENLFWSNPRLFDENYTADRSDELIGGLGGERLWFAPELDYNWDGEPDWRAQANYKVPREIDPGSYEFLEEGARTISLRNTGYAPVHGREQRVGFEILRKIRLATVPIPMVGLGGKVDFFGIEIWHQLRLLEGMKTGRLGLWHLLQVPVGSILVVPTKGVAAQEGALQSYALPGSWEQRADHVSWHFQGVAKAKLGISAKVVTGRSAVLRPLLTGSWCMIIRDFPFERGGTYLDHPYGVLRNDQAFQAWDGLGFGEMEFHSPGLEVERGPKVYEESNCLWAFRAETAVIALLAQRLLGVDVNYILNSTQAKG